MRSSGRNDNSGIVPFKVRFDGTASHDPDGDSLSYRWDLDGDGAYDDSTASKPSRTFADPGAHRVRLKVTDGRGGIDTAQVTIMAGPQPVGASFTDVPVGYVFYEDIEWLLAEGVTEGCNPEGTMFCPTESVTRGQMAAFLVRYLGLTDPGPGIGSSMTTGACSSPRSTVSPRPGSRWGATLRPMTSSAHWSR